MRTLFRYGLLAIATAATLLLGAPWRPVGTPVPEHAHGHDGPWPFAQAALAQATGLLGAFDGTPAAPLPFSQHPDYANFDVQVHSRDRETWQQLEPMAAQHGANCAAPPATHSNTSYEGAVFVCNNHLMTAINASGYGVIYLTPNRPLDVAGGGTVTFDLSTERMSVRDWIDVLITPWQENLSVPLLSDLSQGVDLQGPPLNMISIATDTGEAAPVLKVVRNGNVQAYRDGLDVPPLHSGVAAGTNQAATRQTFRFSIGGGRMRFERLASSTAPALVYWDVAATVNWTGPAVVQFGHHSYTPTKDDRGGRPATWHWDNLTVASNDPTSPASQPFSIQHAAPRFLSGAGTVTFPPAPEDAHLRFSAICRVRVNGQLVARQPTADDYHPEHVSSYFVPIPADSTSATIAFQGDSEYPGPCHAKDFHVWSLASAGSPTPTPTPIPVACSPRPPVTTSVEKQSPGVLRATIAATGANNTIRRLDFTPVNAIVRVSGLADKLVPFATNPNAASTTFRIVQRSPGAASANLVVTDGCGTWRTFVGGGPSAF